MNNLIKLKIFSVLLLLLIACDKEEQKMEDLYFIDIKEENNDWDYLALSRDGGSFLIKEKNDLPEVIFFRASKDHEGYPIFLDDQGYPSMAIILDHIFLFKKADNYHVDIAMIKPNGEIVITRNIETGFDWADLNNNPLKAAQSWNKVLKWTGRAASVVGCGLSIKAAIVTGGMAIPLAYIGCGAMITSFAAQAVDAPILESSSEGLSLAITGIGCTAGNVGVCIAGVTSSATWFIEKAYEIADQNKASIRTGQGVLMGGHGDIQVNLTWNRTCDLDLWIVDPKGETIKWNNPTSSSGGFLDYDNQYGYGPENVFWSSGKALTGNYQVKVNYYGGSGTATYSVIIIIGDHVLNLGKPFTGQITPNQTVHVANFSYGGISSSIRIGEIESTTIQIEKKDNPSSSR